MELRLCNSRTSDGGTVEHLMVQQWNISSWNIRTSNGANVEHLMMDQWDRDDGETVEHLMVEQCTMIVEQ